MSKTIKKQCKNSSCQRNALIKLEKDADTPVKDVKDVGELMSVGLCSKCKIVFKRSFNKMQENMNKQDKERLVSKLAVPDFGTTEREKYRKEALELKKSKSLSEIKKVVH